MEPFVFVLLAAAVAVAIVAARHRMARIGAEWASAARVIGARSRPRGAFRSPRISGEVRGFPLVVDVVRKSRGNHSEGFTRYTLGYPTLGLGLRLRRQGGLSGVAKLFGAQDIVVGDRPFDAAVVVKAAREDALREYLTPARRWRIQRAFNRHPGLVIEERGVVLEARGVASKAQTIVTTVKSLVRLATTLTSEEEPSHLDRALGEQAAGRLEEALTLTREDQEQPDPDPDASVLAGGVLLAAGRHAEAAEALAGARREQPEDPEVEALAALAAARSAAATRPAEPEAAAAPAPPAAARQAAEPPLDDPLPACHELFAAGMTSTEADRLFEERYRDRPVRWSGRVQRVDAYYSDLVFGPGPGCKGVFELCEIEVDSYGGRKVQAVVQLPPEAQEGLRARDGQRVAFRGRLVRCDAFMRNLFVAEGRLEEPADEPAR